MPKTITVAELDTQIPEILTYARPDDRPEFLDPHGDALRTAALHSILAWYDPARDEWDTDNVPDETVTRMAEALRDHFTALA